MGSGLWSWKKNQYSRIQLIQKDKVFKFSQNETLQSTALRIANKPNVSSIGLLRIPKEWGFNPLEKWTLEFSVNESFAS